MSVAPERVAQAVLRGFFGDPDGFVDMSRDERVRSAVRSASAALAICPWWLRLWQMLRGG